jgi:two-component system CheB/CheR fusion protein
MDYQISTESREDKGSIDQPVVISEESSRGAEQPRYVVGVGASAGGLEALEQFFDEMPSDTGLAFVVIQHLSPDYKSLMVELLSKHTKMTVQRAENNLEVRANNVYLIPPRTTMTLRDGRIQLAKQDPERALHLPIDIFFCALGKDQGEQAVGVVLSGTGSDGMQGVRAIKDAGGMVMVQQLEDAKFDGMPRSAVSTGLADFILPANEMPQALLQFVRNPRMITEGKDASDVYQTKQEALQRVIESVRKHTGVDFAFYKPATIVRRVERRMNINQCGDLEDYAQLVRDSAGEATTLYKELLIGVTRFFRDADAFEVIRKKVIPQVFENSSSDEPIRVWVPACSTGEEAYSLGMLFQEYLETHQVVREIKIFATDIDQRAVEFAAEGIYPESVVADLTPQRMEEFFVKRQDRYYVSRQLREMIIFAPQNLTKDPPFSNMDLVSCRNLLIYLQPSMQKRVLAMMAYALKRNGFMFLGASESLGANVDIFRPISNSWKVYQKIGSGRNLLHDTLQAPRPRANQPQRFGTSHAFSDALLEKALQSVMVSQQSACLLLKEDFSVLHVFGSVEDLVQLQPGRASLDARKIMNPDLSVALSTAVSRCQKTEREVNYSRLHVSNKDLYVDLSVRPLSTQESEAAFIVTFRRSNSATQTETEEGEVLSADERMQQRIRDLEQELQYTRANLQATIEELQTSNEELQATNEELVTSNEELQSTNEELQSVNEELHTVNTEYQEKIEELTQLNNDMDNLLRATEIGTLFLDVSLQIRKYTPSLTELVNILPQDLGRPVSHLSTRVAGLNLETFARDCLQSRKTLLHDVLAEDGRCFLLRFCPYWTDESKLDGVVMTMVNVTEIRRAEGRTQMIIDLLPAEVMVVNADGKVSYVNRTWIKHRDLHSDVEAAVLGKDYKAVWLSDDPDKAQKIQAYIGEVLETSQSDTQRSCESSDGSSRVTVRSLAGEKAAVVCRISSEMHNEPRKS